MTGPPEETLNGVAHPASSPIDIPIASVLLLLFMLWIAGFTVLLGALGLAYWGLVRRPLHQLTRIMELAEKKDFLARAPIQGSKTVVHLSRSFNRMLERITTLDAFKLETERQLIMAQEELKYKRALEEKGEIIEKTNRELEARLQEISLLHEFSHKVSATLELEELFYIVDEFLGDRLGFKEFAFLVSDEWQEELTVRVARGFADQSRVRGMTFRAGEGITGRVLAGKEEIYIPDTGLERNYQYYKGEKKEDGSFLSIPLLFKKRIVGVLNFTRSGIDRFSPDEIRFLKTLGAEVAIALANARLYQKTRELSVRDELTQLYNRRHFQQIMPLEIKRAQRFNKSLSLLMIDIDHFKAYNDRYGHREGDERLKEFSRLIGGKIREVDFIARFGGEEFIVILPSTSKTDATTVAEKLRLLVREHPFTSGEGGEKERLTISLGVASYPGDGSTMEELIDAADVALYDAKGKGRDRTSVFMGAENGRRVAAEP